MSWDGIKDYGFGSKNRTKKVDDEYRSRIKGVPRKRVWTKDKCIEELEDILKYLKKILREDAKIEKNNPGRLKREAVRDLNTMMNRILEFMRYLYPPVTQNVNVNIDTTADKVIDRIANYKKEQKEIEVMMKDDRNM